MLCFIFRWSPSVTMEIVKNYLHGAALAPKGTVKSVSSKKAKHSGFRLKKKQDKLDQHQILVFHGDVDHFSICSFPQKILFMLKYV